MQIQKLEQKGLFGKNHYLPSVGRTNWTAADSRENMSILDKLVDLNNADKCFYDGITFVIWGQEILEHCVANAKSYALKGDFDVETDTKLWSFKGRYKNFDLKTVQVDGKRGVYLGGSIHKYIHGNNYGIFLWSELVRAIDQIQQEFKFDPSQTSIWVLECGFNLLLRNEWSYPTMQIPKRIIYLVGDAAKYNLTRYARGATALEIDKGRRKLKSYDKGTQEQRPENILRNEGRYKTRALAKFGLGTIKDLLDYSKHLEFANDVVDSFQYLIIYQTEVVDNPDLPIDDKVFLLEFNSNEAWVNLRRASEYKFQRNRERFNKLMDKYCPVNYSREIYNLMENFVK